MSTVRWSCGRLQLADAPVLRGVPHGPGHPRDLQPQPRPTQAAMYSVTSACCGRSIAITTDNQQVLLWPAGGCVLATLVCVHIHCKLIRSIKYPWGHCFILPSFAPLFWMYIFTPKELNLPTYSERKPWWCQIEPDCYFNRKDFYKSTGILMDGLKTSLRKFVW